ncbi:phospholipid/cholesterol/gamma-HCH transport system substrate-binding protein [Enhydrobacter aerosaccus]|uniref:Phospholipid/cholesterol/gamma-HCH transport system substrate-binding protein n=1 Tax=Enhydrobacter aerosaccus TaxID=225324 RepID=A0A1T4LQY5_9HYPH|nr:outer membrane lipid asymmetry maintenance protein MlaD [Enhydrobacter aerosaccus]SJZ57036.1 phospholipid/cholesterol/gamma-HCH transport system substrate-binding protein [Enhydrobacter aerosaccus]
MGRNIVETIVGAIVLVVAGVFVFYAFAKTDRTGSGGYDLVAHFGRVDGLKRGADVTLSGVKVGTVTGIDLDSKTYQAVVHLAVAQGLQLPTDTNAKVVGESLLGGMIVVLEPGADKKMLTPGSEIANTQDAISLTELIAKFMFGGTGQK